MSTSLVTSVVLCNADGLLGNADSIVGYSGLCIALRVVVLKLCPLRDHLGYAPCLRVCVVRFDNHAAIALDLASVY